MQAFKVRVFVSEAPLKAVAVVVFVNSIRPRETDASELVLEYFWPIQTIWAPAPTVDSAPVALVAPEPIVIDTYWMPTEVRAAVIKLPLP